MGGQRTQDALSMLWSGTKTATEPYRQFATSTLDLPSRVLSDHIETLRPAMQKILGSNAGDLMTDQLKLSGGIVAPTLLAPEAEGAEVLEGARAQTPMGTLAGSIDDIAAGATHASKEPPKVGEVSHKAHLARHVGRIATGAEGLDDEPQRPRAYPTPAPNYQQLLQMLGGGVQGPLALAQQGQR